MDAAIEGEIMFGHQDQDDQDNQNQTDAQTATEPQADATLGAGGTSVPPVDEGEVDEALKALAAHATPDDPTTTSSVGSAPSTDSTSDPVSPASDLTDTDAGTSQLLDLKQSALQELTPLLDQLEQSPEEKFRTTMMMIQAADNKTLLQTAYDTAQKIEDEKVRAQALLDVVNEINYFTQTAEN